MNPENVWLLSHQHRLCLGHAGAGPCLSPLQPSAVGQGVVLRWAAPPSLFLFAGFREIAVESHIVVRRSTELVHCLEFSNGNSLQN